MKRKIVIGGFALMCILSAWVIPRSIVLHKIWDKPYVYYGTDKEDLTIEEATVRYSGTTIDKEHEYWVEYLIKHTITRNGLLTTSRKDTLNYQLWHQKRNSN